MKSIALAVTLILAPLASFAKAPSADQVLAPAEKQAASEKKAIFVHFGASWCGWCKKLDGFLERADIKPVFEKYFVPVKLVVQEKDKNKDLENPGAEKMLKKMGGPAGLPFFAFLDAKGGLITNSMRGGANIGYPAQPEEIDWFVRMMKKAAPEMSEKDAKQIQTALREKKKT